MSSHTKWSEIKRRKGWVDDGAAAASRQVFREEVARLEQEELAPLARQAHRESRGNHRDDRRDS